jgi:hypothetical protein
MVALLHYININSLPMTLMERLDLQPLEKRVVRRGNMDIELIHVNPIDVESCSRTWYGPMQASGK